MPRTRAPRRGSMAYVRKRAKKEVPRIRYWPEVDSDKPLLLGFSGYKAGMLHAIVVDDRPNSPTYGSEIAVPITVLDAPPMLVCAVRVYEQTPYGLRTVGEAWMEDPPKCVRRRVKLPEKVDTASQLEEMESRLDRVADVRVIAATRPDLIRSLPKKTSDLMEIKVGGKCSVQEKYEYAKSVLGKEFSARDVFREGQFVDVVAVTKGKGFQGVVKRFGVKIKHHKSRKSKREVGSIGPWHPPFVMRTVPRAGQLGYFRRTIYNLRILKIGEDGSEITPKGGFMHYGVIRGPYIVLSGSTPGPPKRLIRLRHPARPKWNPESAPTIVEVVGL